MNSNHLLLATLALFLADFLEHVQSSPTLSSVDSFDDVDMSLLRRAMRQGNDCDSQVAYTGKKHLVSFKMMLTNGSSIYLIIFFLQEEVRELCQRCAKVTRSTVAYPLCCQPRENPRIWCMKFLAFGISK